MMHKFYLSGKTNSVLLNFDSSSILEWYQQLLSESLGKKGKGFFNYFKLTKDNHSLVTLFR